MLWRSYEVSEVIWVDEPGTFGQISQSLGYNPYLTPAQNEVLLFSNLLGTETFNNALADKLMSGGAIATQRERAALIASLGSLTVAPGGATTVTNTDYAANRTMSIHYTCSNESLCKTVLIAALDVYRDQYANQKARAVASAKAIYTKRLEAAEAQVAAGIAAIQAYDAAHPRAQGSTDTDPVRNSLQHRVDQAEGDVDQAKKELQLIDTGSQVSSGITADMAVIDPPRTAKSLFGIKGLRSDNLKTDAIVFGVCLVAAIAYLILVAFIDRTVREPSEITSKLGKAVVTIPDYHQAGRRRWSLRRKAALSGNG